MAGMGQCCAAGEIHTGTPTGTIKKVHGLDCYVAEPPSGNPKGIVVIIPDALGWVYVNNKILADEYAKKGEFRVYLPEFMAGWSLPTSLWTTFEALEAKGLAANIFKLYHAAVLMFYLIPFAYVLRASVSRPRIFNFFQAIRANEGSSLPIGTAGFCWGGKWSCILAWDDEKTPDGKSLIDCAYMAHPSMLSFPGDIEKIKIPMSVASAEHDNMVSLKNYEVMKTILEEKTKKDLGEHDVKLYKGAHHGFAVRGSPTIPEESQRGLEAEEQAVNWFKKWFESWKA